MMIFVSLPYKASITLEVEPTDMISTVSGYIADKTTWTDGQYWDLYFAGKFLLAENTLQDYSIQKDSTLHLQFFELNIAYKKHDFIITPVLYHSSLIDTIIANNELYNYFTADEISDMTFACNNKKIDKNLDWKSVYQEYHTYKIDAANAKQFDITSLYYLGGGIGVGLLLWILIFIILFIRKRQRNKFAYYADDNVGA
ncbi:MAG: hypothetical protein LBV22_01320 [Mycoplasmataceae bacterium]|jgi:hypothetical protein|nr:hypothetical protein [Mycoplasmataceae bacterium]